MQNLIANIALFVVYTSKLLNSHHFWIFIKLLKFRDV